MEAQNQAAPRAVRDLPDARRQPRFRLDVDIRINTKTCGVLAGRTVDISESGISALLKLEVPVGEFVELQFTLPFGQSRLCSRSPTQCFSLWFSICRVECSARNNQNYLPEPRTGRVAVRRE